MMSYTTVAANKMEQLEYYINNNGVLKVLLAALNADLFGLEAALFRGTKVRKRIKKLFS